MPSTPVYLEIGTSSVFAVSLDWPGWCRRAKSAELAIEELDSYRTRYASLVARRSLPGTIEVIGSLPGNATTDFGAPGAIGPWDDEPLGLRQLTRQCELLEACWRSLDRIVDTAPERLTKGPRGGGRDRDAIRQHVKEAERAYCSKVGVRIAPRTAWNQQRGALLEVLRSPSPSSKWPQRYALRRIAWHVSDHAWEIEDRSGHPRTESS